MGIIRGAIVPPRLHRSSLQVAQICWPGRTEPVLLKSLKMSSQVAPYRRAWHPRLVLSWFSEPGMRAEISKVREVLRVMVKVAYFGSGRRCIRRVRGTLWPGGIARRRRDTRRIRIGCCWCQMCRRSRWCRSLKKLYIGGCLDFYFTIEVCDMPRPPFSRNSI